MFGAVCTSEKDFGIELDKAAVKLPFGPVARIVISKFDLCMDDAGQGQYEGEKQSFGNVCIHECGS
jgi:hypothetical protein